LDVIRGICRLRNDRVEAGKIVSASRIEDAGSDEVNVTNLNAANVPRSSGYHRASAACKVAEPPMTKSCDDFVVTPLIAITATANHLP
jgi:hypothetical protein